MESINYFTSSRGLLKICNSHNKLPKSSSSEIDQDLLKNLCCGGSVYICSDALENFAEKFLDQINTPFTLVTGDSDRSIDDYLLKTKAAEKIINNNYCINWFAQNLLTKNEKIKPLPIGVDYHTMWSTPGLWGQTRQTSIAQEFSLISIFSQSKKTLDRYYTGYCNWQFAMHRGDREDCMKKIDKNISFIEPYPLPTISSWQRQSECMFVISPEGAGVDCHRTWEAILLGCIPVVKKSINSELLKDLPVFILEDWSEFNSENMLKVVEGYHNKKYNFSPLFLNYWRMQFSRNEIFNMDPMTIEELKQFLFIKSY